MDLTKVKAAETRQSQGASDKIEKGSFSSSEIRTSLDKGAASDAARFKKFSIDAEIEAKAAASQFGLEPEFETERGKVMRITGKTASGIPTMETTTSLATNTANGTDQIWANYSISGANRTVGLFDLDLPLSTHQDLVGRVINGAALGLAGTHATSMAGLLASNGTTTLLGDTTQGASFGATVLANYGNSTQYASMNGFALDQMRVHSHSYTSTSGWTGIVFPGTNFAIQSWISDISVSMVEPMGFGRYTLASSNTDAVVRNRPYTLPVWAIGNERGETAANQGFPVQLFVGGISQGVNFFYTFRSPSPGAQAVAGFFNGTTFWPFGSSAFWGTTTPGPGMPAQFLFPAGSPSFAIGIGGAVPLADGGVAGYDSIPDGYPMAKNILVTGAVNTTAPPNVLAGFSSCGPTDDGRIKPDLLDSGVNVVVPTAASNSTAATASGTSYAAPQVAGSISLWAELHEQLWGPKHPYSASTYKALAIHTATDMISVGPDYQTGWGCFNAIEGATLIESNFASSAQRLVMKEVDLTATQDASFTVKAAGTPIKITAAWTDPIPTTLPGDVLDPNNPMVVNNIDIELYKLVSPSPTAANGTRYFQWRLDPANPAASVSRLLADQNDATKDRNNVEQITMPLSAVTNAWYRVIVKKKGTFTGDANGNQRVSLVFSGLKEKTVGSEYIFQVTGQNYVVVAGQVCAQLTWNSIAGETYRIEFTSNLANGPWVDAMPIVSGSPTKVLAKADSTVAVSRPLVNLGPSGFFRISTIAPNPFNLP